MATDPGQTLAQPIGGGGGLSYIHKGGGSSAKVEERPCRCMRTEIQTSLLGGGGGGNDDGGQVNMNTLVLRY